MIEIEEPNWLVFVPTEFEKNLIPKVDCDWFRHRNVRIELIGFGPISSAARVAQLIGRLGPKKCVLMGIAGSYCDDLLPGKANSFSEVALCGVGVGAGAAFQSASELGWPLFSDGQFSISDRIVIDASQHSPSQLLTVCSASSGMLEVEEKLSRFPQAVAEDMEGYGVAIACKLSQCPLRIVRGISNKAGERDKSKWKVADAMRSAVSLTKELIDA